MLTTMLKKNCGKLMYQNIAPRVITEQLLYKTVEEQGPKGEAGRLFKEDGIELDKVEKISLAFQNILTMNGISLLKNLTNLSLNNNLIDKIESLEELVNLKVLNLSFNFIEEIENIDHLVNLEDLTLFSNKITEIKNMSNLKNLRMFSIGNNKIENLENLIHLRPLKKLFALNITGNPCCTTEGYDVYASVILPNLSHLNYKFIDPKLREEGEVLYKETLKNLIREEELIAEQLAKEEKEKLDNEFYAKCFVEDLDGRQLFDSLFANDPDGQILLTIPEVQTLYKEFEEEFLQLTRKLFEIGKEKYKERENEIKEYFECVEEAKRENVKECQDMIDEYLNMKAEIVDKMNVVRDSLPTEASEIVDYTNKMNNLNEEFGTKSQDVWFDLMSKEMDLYEQLADTNLFFERNLTELVNNLIEEAQGVFTFCRGLEQNYMEQVSMETSKTMVLYNMKEEIDLIPEVKALMEDKELLNNAIAASHDIHMQLIDSREDQLIARSRSWLNDLIETINKEEINRNREKVIEISHFLQCHREELEDIQNEGPNFNPDITAALGN